jgi:hypothetical protein
MKSEPRRLNKLKDESRNIAKRYKLPEAAVNIFEKAEPIHGQRSRAIQVAVELLWDKTGFAVPDSVMSAILDSLEREVRALTKRDRKKSRHT